MEKIKKPSDRRREAVIKLQKEVKDLKTIISKNDAVIRRKDLQIAGLKKELKKTENLTFRERIFGKKRKNLSLAEWSISHWKVCKIKSQLRSSLESILMMI